MGTVGYTDGTNVAKISLLYAEMTQLQGDLDLRYGLKQVTRYYNFI